MHNTHKLFIYIFIKHIDTYMEILLANIRISYKIFIFYGFIIFYNLRKF